VVDDPMGGSIAKIFPTKIKQQCRNHEQDYPNEHGVIVDDSSPSHEKLALSICFFWNEGGALNVEIVDYH